uniref:Uncharacterized protein n=1 Tax=Arundo donax TaxID=35708 RepID=A0A0A9BAY3_ARUDO
MPLPFLLRVQQRRC